MPKKVRFFLEKNEKKEKMEKLENAVANGNTNAMRMLALMLIQPEK